MTKCRVTATTTATVIAIRSTATAATTALLTTTRRQRGFRRDVIHSGLVSKVVGAQQQPLAAVPTETAGTAAKAVRCYHNGYSRWHGMYRTESTPNAVTLPLPPFSSISRGSVTMGTCRNTLLPSISDNQRNPPSYCCHFEDVMVLPKSMDTTIPRQKTTTLWQAPSPALRYPHTTSVVSKHQAATTTTILLRSFSTSPPTTPPSPASQSESESTTTTTTGHPPPDKTADDDPNNSTTTILFQYKAPMADLVSRLKIISITTCVISVGILPAVVALKNGGALLLTAQQLSMGGVALFGATSSTLALDFVFGPYVLELTRWEETNEVQPHATRESIEKVTADTNSTTTPSSSSTSLSTSETTTILQATTRSVFGWKNTYRIDPAVDTMEPYSGGIRPFANVLVNGTLPLYVHAERLDDTTRQLLLLSQTSQEDKEALDPERKEQQHQHVDLEGLPSNKKKKDDKDDDFW